MGQLLLWVSQVGHRRKLSGVSQGPEVAQGESYSGVSNPNKCVLFGDGPFLAPGARNEQMGHVTYTLGGESRSSWVDHVNGMCQGSFQKSSLWVAHVTGICQGSF